MESVVLALVLTLEVQSSDDVASVVVVAASTLSVISMIVDDVIALPLSPADAPPPPPPPPLVRAPAGCASWRYRKRTARTTHVTMTQFPVSTTTNGTNASRVKSIPYQTDPVPWTIQYQGEVDPVPDRSSTAADPEPG